jgi:hypothetical protein
MSCKPLLLAGLLSLPAQAIAQDEWNYRVTGYGWATGLSSTVETPIGDLEAEVDFDEIIESLDLAFFGAFEARQGRWAFIVDGMYADLTTEVETFPAGNFSEGEIETQVGLIGGYVTYALVDGPGTRIDIGPGFRYTDVQVDASADGVDPTPDRAVSVDGSWTDFVIAARLTQAFSENWYGVAYADIGGFGIEESSEITWQTFGGIGYSFGGSWSGLGGYRYLHIDRDFGPTNVETNISGPFIGLQKTF